MANIALSISNAVILFHGQQLFKQLNLQVRSGEAWMIIGKTASGKTALLEAIAGKWPVTYGLIEIHRNVNSTREHLHNSGITLVSAKHSFTNLSNTTDLYYQQRYNSYDSEDSSTVLSYLQLSRQTEQDKTLITDIVSKLRIENLLNEQLIKLSNGETKKVLLAAALVRKPAILLLDNFFAGLDQQSRLHFSDLLAEFCAKGGAVLLTSSIMQLPGFITHVARLDNGQLFSKPVHEFIADKQIVQKQVRFGGNRAEKFLASELPFYNDIVRMQNVNVVYDGKNILDGITWNVKQGERWALTGSNGAGKTTLLSLITGDNPQAYANDIILFDRKRGSGESIWDIKRKIGFVSPELHQYFPTETNCLDTIESGFYDTLGLFRQPHPDQRARCIELSALLGIDHTNNKLLAQVSYKEQRLCLLARALVKKPVLLVLDEPFQGFDEEEIEVFKDVLNSVCMINNTTMIFVSHYDEDIPSAVTMHLQLDNGRVKYCGER